MFARNGTRTPAAPAFAAAIPLDANDLPSAPCPACAGGALHAAPGGPWRCSGCEPPELPAAEGLAGWRFAGVPIPRELAAAARALSAEARADEGELCARGELT